jgi:hypothetical protein
MVDKSWTGIATVRRLIREDGHLEVMDFPMSDISRVRQIDLGSNPVLHMRSLLEDTIDDDLYVNPRPFH